MVYLILLLSLSMPQDVLFGLGPKKVERQVTRMRSAGPMFGLGARESQKVVSVAAARSQSVASTGALGSRQVTKTVTRSTATNSGLIRSAAILPRQKKRVFRQQWQPVQVCDRRGCRTVMRLVTVEAWE